MQTKYQFVPLTNDLLFKETFGRNINFLEYLLEVYYNYPFGFLKDKLEVSYESILDKSKYHDKGFRSDLKVIINNEIICDIEMFTKFDYNSLEKSKSYVMRIYSTQLKIGEDYNQIKKVTQINFIDNISNALKVTIDENLTQTFYFGNELLSKDISMDLVKLDLARNIDYNLDDKFIRLLKFISAKTEEERETFAKGDEILMEMNKWINDYMTDDDWWRTFNDDYWKRRGAIREIAKNMLKETNDLEFISRVTNLSVEEVAKLKED